MNRKHKNPACSCPSCKTWDAAWDESLYNAADVIRSVFTEIVPKESVITALMELRK